MPGEVYRSVCLLGLDTFVYTFNQAFVQKIVTEYLVGAKVYSEKEQSGKLITQGDSESERFSFSTTTC